MLTALLLALITFAVNSVFLTLYFSATLLDFLSKLTIHVDALKITLPGTILLSIFVFLSPIMPRFMPSGPLSSSIDIGISAAAVIWIVLTRRYCETSWLGAIVITAIPVIMCLFFITFVDKLLGLVLRFGETNTKSLLFSPYLFKLSSRNFPKKILKSS